MAYGLQCWDSYGVLVMEITDRISRLRYKTTASAGTNGSVTLPDIDGKTTSEFGFCIEDDKYPHYVYRSGTTIYWDARAETKGVDPRASGNTQVYVFLTD